MPEKIKNEPSQLAAVANTFAALGDCQRSCNH